MKPEETVDFHIRWAWAKISRMYNVQASKYDGTMSIGYALLNIDREGTPSTSLGPKMGMESRSLTRTLRTMEEEGLIRRENDKADRRMVRIFLTKKGLEYRENSKKVVITFNEYMKQNISEEKLQVFREVMTEMNDLLDQNRIFS